jgi:glutamyl-Q tRNA(Asp) synthetase
MTMTGPRVSPEVTRFAPSPTGPLHLGHALAARVARDLARSTAGRFLLRLEDIDTARCQARYEAGIYADLRWLGLQWDGEVLRQSEHLPRYRAQLGRLTAAGLTYPCFCTRAEIAAEVAAMGSAPQGLDSPDGPTYPGTCRRLPGPERAARLAGGLPHALRLDVERCRLLVGTTLAFEETGSGPAGEHGTITVDTATLSDIVLARKDLGVSYHLAVVVDDDYQGVTLVTRGEDLFGATGVQRLLQAALGLKTPRYHHHRLVRDAAGRRLAKRDVARAIASLREAGQSPEAVLASLG